MYKLRQEFKCKNYGLKLIKQLWYINKDNESHWSNLDLTNWKCTNNLWKNLAIYDMLHISVYTWISVDIFYVNLYVML